ncbi:hypothetical protein BRADI_1g09415v3 [Brachypodium distachyon]|uniref:Uncharacterized protein n=1 Tax=Brachypodium distachyon TaxID=15368 RepID=A0A2K2DIS3_BRADI|nr:hypothetical protein BRADI_1g09415v3 [Brachypodium distachyon]
MRAAPVLPRSARACVRSLFCFNEISVWILATKPNQMRFFTCLRKHRGALLHFLLGLVFQESGLREVISWS